MGKFLGFPLFAIGLILAAFTYYPAAFERSSHFFDAVAREAAAAPRDHEQASRAFAPRAAFAAVETAEPASTARKPDVGERKSVPARTAAISAAAPTPQEAARSPWSAQVQTAPRASGEPPKVASSKPSDGAARYLLTRNIQRELRRVGCYRGAIDGSWGTGSKRSMSAFMERVNASLPMQDPDEILLTLIKAHASATCGPHCPTGQNLAGDGRCVPGAILAQAAKKGFGTEPRKPTAAKRPADAQTPWTTTAWTTETIPARATISTARASAPLPGLMAIGGPQQGADALNGGWTAEVVPPRPVAAVRPQIARQLPTTRTAALSESTLQGNAPPDGTGDQGPPTAGTPYGAVSSLDEGLPSPAEPIARAPHRERKAGARTTQPGAQARNHSGYRAVKHLFEHPLGHM